jgi:hypothetical protein
MSKQWSSFTENQKQADAWREFLNEKMDREMRSLRFQDRPAECPPCPECPDEQGEKKEELPEQPIDQSQFMEPVKGFQDLNQDLFQGRLDDAAIMREYQQFLRAQNIKVVDQGKELDLSEIRNPFRRRQATPRGAMEHERKPKMGKLEDMEKYPNLYKLVTAGLKSDDYRESLLVIFKNAGFGDVREFASAYVQEQPAQQQQQSAEQPAQRQQQPAQPTGNYNNETGEPLSPQAWAACKKNLSTSGAPDPDCWEQWGSKAPEGTGGEEAPGQEQGGAEAPPPGTAVKQGDSYVYASGKGNKRKVGVVQVTDTLPARPDAVQVTQLNPADCKPATKRVFATGVKNLGEPYDKCKTPQAEGVEHDDKVLLEKWHRLAGIIKG